MNERRGRSFRLILSALLLLVVIPASAEVDTKLNQIGRLTSVGNGAERLYQQYDTEGRVVATQYVQDGRSSISSTKFGYPVNPATTAGPGMVIAQETLPDGEQLSYTYDASGEIVGIRTILGSSTEDILRDRRINARGQVSLVALGNGTSTTYGYDDAGHLRLTRIATVNAAAQKLQEYVYSYDDNGNVDGTTDGVRPDQSVTLEYDSLDQLTAMKNPAGSVIEQYDYDAIGNLTQKGVLTQTYNAGGRPHALASSSGVAYQYDSNGNVISIGGTTTIAWTAENMPERVATPAVVIDKAFVGEELWKKTEQGATTYYLPGVRIENGVMRKYYGSYAERVEQAGGRQLRFYHPDHLGSSSVMTDHTGAVIRRVTYFPWGQDRGVEATFTPKLQFNFKEKDAAGFYDYGARLYNPVSGRWLSPDSVRDGFNPYVYVGNNPWSSIDPTGHRRQDPQNTPIDLNGGLVPCSADTAGEKEACAAGEIVYIGETDQKSKPNGRIVKEEYEPGYVPDPVSFQGQMGIRWVHGVTTRHIKTGLHTDVFQLTDNGVLLWYERLDCKCGGSRDMMIRDPWNPLGLPIPTPMGAGKKLIGSGAQRLAFGSRFGRAGWTGGAQGLEKGRQLGRVLNDTNAGKALQKMENMAGRVVGQEKAGQLMHPAWMWASKPFASGARGAYPYAYGSYIGRGLQMEFDSLKSGVTPIGFYFQP
jgi:RHS repeat-associated protein